VSAASEDPTVRAWCELDTLVPEDGSLSSCLMRDGTYVVKAKWDRGRTVVIRSAPTFREAVGLVTVAVREALS
jgi:hypothetical protein